MQAAARTGDLVQLNRRFRPALMAFFLRRIGSHAEAEDLTQEVFARLINLSPGELNQADAYIFQIAANLLRDRGRREKVRADYRTGVLAGEGVGVEPIDPERVLAGRQSLGQIAAALREAPERTRSIFILYRVEQMKKRDIAETFGISTSAVDKHLMKAMAHLWQRLGSRP
ncbi:MAG TPA: sigma-70 family RNA polymerase sigma factor [Caulobacteraceae bacterium]